jgi:serine/threonine protein kinase
VGDLCNGRKSWEMFFIYFLFILYFKICVVKLKEKVGTGGQGIVYAVVDPDTNENYALKKISVAKGIDDVLPEIRILVDSKLIHINLVRYFTFFYEKDFVNIIMELCEEGNLEDYPKKFKDNVIPEEV